MASETFNPDLPERLDSEELGFMCGIEVHQQLATGKLHSRQEGVLFDVTADTNADCVRRAGKVVKWMWQRNLKAEETEGLCIINHQMQD